MILNKINFPKWIIISALLLVIFSLVLVYMVDVLHMFGISQFMLENANVPYLWYHWYLVPIEVLQWPMIGATMIFFAMTAGITLDKNKTDHLFSVFIMIGLLLMLIEDAGNIRHIFRGAIGGLSGDGGYGVSATLFELAYFASIGFVMVFAVVKYRKAYWDDKTLRIYLGLGFVAYAVAVGSSWVGSAFSTVLNTSEIYTLIGEKIMESVFLNGELSSQLYAKANEQFVSVGFFFMDRVYEESIELIGISFLLAASIKMYTTKRKRSTNI